MLVWIASVLACKELNEQNSEREKLLTKKNQLQTAQKELTPGTPEHAKKQDEINGVTREISQINEQSRDTLKSLEEKIKPSPRLFAGGVPIYLFGVPQHEHVSPPTYLSEGLASAPPTPAFYRYKTEPRARAEPETWTLPLAMRRLPRPRWRPKRRPWRWPSMRPPLHPSRGSTTMMCSRAPFREVS